jgi:hypothetical protein
MSRRCTVLAVLATVAVLLIPFASLGCAATTVRSGLPPGNVARGYNDRWHPAFLFGVIPGAEPYDLAHICPSGWSQVTVTRDPFTLLFSLATLFVYSPSRVTIVCGERGTSGLPPYQGYVPTADTSPGPHMPAPPEGD